MTMKEVQIPIGLIYVPARRRGEVDDEVVETLAESIIEEGMKVPISVRQDAERYVLVSGLQRLEACKALGEETVTAIVVGTPRR